MSATNRLLALPLDARPAVRAQVVHLMAAGGWELVVPPADRLGHLRQPADRDALVAWITREASTVAGFVLSLDMLVYGGLVPSRFVDDEEGALASRLLWLRQLRAAHPGKPLYAFASTMRISRSLDAEEEKPYWSAHGLALWAWSFHQDRHAQLSDPEDEKLAREAAASVPETILQDYLATRARNHAITRRMLQLVGEGVIDRLVLPQDDTAEFGLNIAERRTLQAEVATLGLQERVPIYPGADEVLHTACAHAVQRLSGRPPRRVALSAMRPAALAALVPRYEDRPLADSVRSQIAASGACLVDDAAQADIVLALYTQGASQGDWALQQPLPQRESVDPAWLASLAAHQRAGRAVAVADLAFANGGDPWFVHVLAGALELRGLAAYAGWNTAGNTLGSALAQALLAHGHPDAAAHRHNLALRLAEDVLWQAELRQVVRLGGLALPPGELAEHVQRLFVPQANAWLAPWRLGWQVRRSYLPWDRTFEIGLELEPAP
jgi:hypothetical protein